MENKRLEKNRNKLKEYNDIKNLIETHEELKYKWYLVLQDILFSYLGNNKEFYKSPDEFRNYPVQFY